MLTRFVRHYLLAIQFFTRIPVTGRLAQWVGYSTNMLRASAAHFPGVGWVVGGLTAAIYAVLIHLLPALPESAWVAAVLSTIFSVLLTGAFHEDGLADTADGLGGGLTRAHALEIMKDSRIGTYGTIALLLILLLKLGSLVLLQKTHLNLVLLGIFTAHVTSRFLPLFVIRGMLHVGDTPQSKSKPLAEQTTNAGVLIGSLWWIAAMALATWWISTEVIFAGVVGASLAAGVLAWRLQRRLQGFTGDGLGATQQFAEVGFYLGMIFAIESV